MTTFPFYPADKRKRFEEYASSYKFDQTDPTPWTPLKRDLKDCKITFITTAGLRIKSQPLYYIDNVSGCPEYREIPIHTKKESIIISHTGFDTAEAKKDINVIAPIDRMIELAEERIVDEVNENFFSFFGIRTDLQALERSAGEVGRMLQRQNVDAIFIIPSSHTCNEVAGIISRTIEKAGISTISIVTIKEIAEEIKLPRSLFINFPLGYTLGRAHVLPLQRAIINDMVSALKTLDRPGKIIDLQYKWEGTVE